MEKLIAKTVQQLAADNARLLTINHKIIKMEEAVKTSTNTIVSE